MIEKRKPYRNPKILAAAKNSLCLANFSGCTGGHKGDVAFRHFNAHWAGKGGSQKADDCAGFIGCQHCENLYAGLLMQTSDWEIFKLDKHYYLLRAYYNTIRYLLDEGVLS